jgi:hypothetical protein
MNGQLPAANQPRVLATVRNYAELITAIRDRIVELNTTSEVVDFVAGLPLRYSAKLLAPNPPRTIGSLSLGPLIGALGLALVVIEDREQLERIRHRLEPCKKKRMPPVASERKKPINGWSQWMQFQRNLSLSAEERSRLARHAARMRWAGSHRRSRAARIAALARWGRRRGGTR